MTKQSFIILVVILLSLFPAPIAAQRPTSPILSNQTPPASRPQSQSSPASDDEVVRISTNLVQVDVVVADKQGNQVTDLQAEDFEILEDERPQEITNFAYVSSGRDSVQPMARTGGPSGKLAAPPPPLRLRPDQVRRTVALVVDDLGLSFESTAYVRSALKKFVNEQIELGDLVAIIRTSAGTGALQQFTSDKRQLLAAIERTRWYPRGRGGISAFASVAPDPLANPYGALSGQSGSGGSGLRPALEERNGSDIDEFREEIFSVGTLGALNFIVRGLRELPGRKSIVLISDGFPIINRDGRSDRILEALRRLTDLANRASVVVYTIDARGLQTLGLTAADNTAGLNPVQLEQTLSNRRQGFFESQDGLSYLAQQTGGFFIRNNNDLAGGVRRVLEDQRGYYLIGYRPSGATFDATTGRRRFHKVAVKVKRPGAGYKVRSRSGFYGFTETEARPTARTPQQQMIHALTSPFSSGNLNLRLTSLFVNDRQAGSFMRSILHLDGRDISFTDEPDGWHKAVLDVLAVTFGDSGSVVDEANRLHTIRVRGDAYKNLLRHGLTYSLNVPVKKAGAYQLRIAVRDHASAQIGSASQFIEVPNLDKDRIALSGIVLSGQYPQAASGIAAAPPPAAPTPTTAPTPTAAASTATHASSDRTAAPETDSPLVDPQAGPAVRRIRLGMSIEYAYVIYNARLDRTTRRPQLQTQVRLFRDGKQVYAGQGMPLEVGQQADLKRLPVGGRLQLGSNSASGEYVLQVVVSDLLAKEKHRTATQWIDFELAK